jgi:hypothetical protein
MIIISENKSILKETPLPDEWDDDLKNKINIQTDPSLAKHLAIMTNSLSDKEKLLQELEAEGQFTQYGKGTSRVAYHIQNGSQKNTIIKFAYNPKGVAQNGQELRVLLSPDVVSASKSESCIIKLIDYDKESDVYKSSGNPIWLQLEPIITYYELNNKQKSNSSIGEEVFKSRYKCSNDTFNSFLQIKRDEIDLYIKKVFVINDSDWKKYYDILVDTYKEELSGVELKEYCLFILLLGMASELNLKKILITNYHKKSLLDMLNAMKPLLHLYNIKQDFNLVAGDLSGIHNWGYRPSDKEKPVIFDLGLSEEIIFMYYMFGN